LAPGSRTFPCGPVDIAARAVTGKTHRGNVLANDEDAIAQGEALMWMVRYGDIDCSMGDCHD